MTHPVYIYIYCFTLVADCGDDEFSCGDGDCISSNWACDDILDCNDGRDERYCDCATSEFNCFNGLCLSNDVLVCNQQDDCGNNRDELGCPGKMNATATAQDQNSIVLMF